MAELRIPIIVENKGKKALDDVDKGIKGLTKSFGKLAGAAGIGLSTAAVINFGKNAVKAFADNEQSAKRLEMVVKNLGQAFETPFIEQNLDKISAKFGYQGEVLREAYQKLITATGSATKSNELLNLSLDISAGSTVDLLTVNQDLAALYVGNTKGLRKYNLGLSQAQLKTLKYEDAVQLLTKTFKGAGSAELETYSGKIRVLGEAAGNAQEIIGKGLVDALTILGGDSNSIDPIADSMTRLAEETSNVIVGLADITKGLADLVNLGGIGEIEFGTQGAKIKDLFNLNLIPIIGPLLEAARQRGKTINTPGMGGYPSSALGPGYFDQNEAKRKAIEADRLKKEKARLALEKKGAAEAKKRAALEKAARTLEIDRINLTAGLKGQISETDRLSLNLQLALLDKNDAAASKLSGQLDAAVKRQNDLAALLLATPKAPNPYEAWKIPDEILNWAAASLSVSKEILLKDPASIAMPETDAAREMLEAFIDGQKATEKERMAQEQADTIVKLYIDGDELTSSITKSQTNQSLSGSFNQVNRSGRFENIAV
jgi:hypothetical protein